MKNFQEQLIVSINLISFMTWSRSRLDGLTSFRKIRPCYGFGIEIYSHAYQKSLKYEHETLGIH